MGFLNKCLKHIFLINNENHIILLININLYIFENPLKNKDLFVFNL